MWCGKYICQVLVFIDEMYTLNNDFQRTIKLGEYMYVEEFGYNHHHGCEQCFYYHPLGNIIVVTKMYLLLIYFFTSCIDSTKCKPDFIKGFYNNEKIKFVKLCACTITKVGCNLLA